MITLHPQTSRAIKPCYPIWRCQVEIVRPPRTCTDSAQQARAAFRKYREALSSSPTQHKGPIKLTIELPLPSPASKKLNDVILPFDAGEWPGGILQKFRALRPLVETMLLEGYSPEFVGMLESPQDGIGVWSACEGTVTLATQVGNATFAPFNRLYRGEFGSRILEDGHIIIVVNPSFTTSKDIGQLWDAKLKREAAEILENPESPWQPLYHFEDLRTGNGATGVLFKGSYTSPWTLYDTWALEPPEVGAVLLKSQTKPEKSVMREALNEALVKGKAEGREVKQRDDWWRW